MVNRFIIWAKRRAGYKQKIVTFKDDLIFLRFTPFWPDEWVNAKGKHWNRPPWYRPFNILLHWWRPLEGFAEEWHDHPRWTITICLRGKLIERTPWKERVLTPGSITFRTHRFIHSFKVPEGYRGRTWTLFICGRRNHWQSTYEITKHRPGE